jgi:hypothetical protein
MFKCDNCEQPAEYVNSTVASNDQNFCKKCVPWTLQSRLREGSLPKISALEETAVSKTKAKKKSEPVVEPEPVEEVPVEKVVEETPVEEEVPVEEV